MVLFEAISPKQKKKKTAEENLLIEEHAPNQERPVIAGKKEVIVPAKAVEGSLEFYESPNSYESPIARLAREKAINARKPSPLPKKEVGKPLEEVKKAGVVETIKPKDSAVEEEKVKKAVLEKMKDVSKEFIEEKKVKKIDELQKLIPKKKKEDKEQLKNFLKEKIAREQTEKIGGVGKQLGALGGYVKGGLEKKIGGKKIPEKDLKGFSKAEVEKVKDLVKKLQPAAKQYAMEEIKAAMVLEGIPKKVSKKVIEILYMH